MNCSGINKVRHGHLIDSSEPLKPGMGDNPEYDWILDGDESVYGIIYNLPV
jgi:hypothetical protein